MANKFTMEVVKNKATLTLEIHGQTFKEQWIKKGRGWFGALDFDLHQQLEEAGIKISDRFSDALSDRDQTNLMDYMPREKARRGDK